jgi:hypothetical protein
MDSLVQEIRKIREAYAREFGYDLQAIHCDLKRQEQASDRRIVSLPPRPPKKVGSRGQELASPRDIQPSAQGAER